MTHPCSRRRFLGLAAAAPLAATAGCGSGGSTSPSPSATPAPAPTGPAANATVAIARARAYGAEAAAALRQSLDLLGGIGSLVRGRTVTVKVNFTGWPLQPIGGRAPGESYVTNGDTALALAQVLSENGARRIRFVESQGVAQPLEAVAGAAGWSVASLQALGVEFENTRNLGQGGTYARLAVPDGGRVFSYLDVNHSYAETDVFVSLCKMKEHATAAGITLSMKNLFGITPNSLYGDAGTGEDRLGYRGPIHGKAEGWKQLLPGEKPGLENAVVGVRVPRTIVDENLARPVHLAIVDGIRTVRGGEGWWNAGVTPIDPGVIVAGLNPVATDAVGAAVMGFDPRAPHFTAPFETRENHLLIAEQAGLGTADLGRIDVRGAAIADVRTPFRPTGYRWEPGLAARGPGLPIG